MPTKASTLKNASAFLASRRSLALDEIMKDKIICYCLNVSEQEIVGAIREGAESLQDIQKTTKACTGNQCKEMNPSGKCCSTDILEIIKRETGTEQKNNCCCG